jgi:single-stranded-DNA-specific exonuclease
VVFSSLLDPWRGSARSVPGFNLAAAFAECGDLFERFGGHAGAAGCHMPAGNLDAFRQRFLALAPAASRGRRSSVLELDLCLRADSVDYVLFRELAPLEREGEMPPLVGIAAFVLGRIRTVAGGHTQLTLRKGNEVIDAIWFGRSDLADLVQEGDLVDVVARLASRQFAGLETLQLEIRDVAPAGTLARAFGAAPAERAA